ncbi:MAG: hypothetical protein IJD50_00045 [Clostridia bacterium]|nr:hypothetical protein [Clostridia bacterium]
MKKVLTLILISILCLAFMGSLVACNKECKEHVDDDANNVCDVCGETLSNNDNTNTEEGDNESNENVEDDTQIEVVVVPKAEYEREIVGDVNYIYYGSLPQSAVDIELNNVLKNLVQTDQIEPNEEGYYTYANGEYACIVGGENVVGKRLSNGLTIAKDELYFFNVEKLKWRVLEEKDGRTLLICENIIGEHHFNPTGSFSSSLGTLIGTPNNANDYAVSALRTYVNETLFNEIFSLRERQSIYDTQVLLRPGESAFVKTQGMYATTVNKMFVPSYWEINDKYDLKAPELAEQKLYAIEVKDYQVASGFSAKAVAGHYYQSWWLRTSGSHMNMGNIVQFDGLLGTDSKCSVNLDATMGIRPCITLRTA